MQAHCIEAEMARTQKNKATEFHFGVMKARLAKLRSEVCCLLFVFTVASRPVLGWWFRWQGRGL